MMNFLYIQESMALNPLEVIDGAVKCIMPIYTMSFKTIQLLIPVWCIAKKTLLYERTYFWTHYEQLIFTIFFQCAIIDVTALMVKEQM